MFELREMPITFKIPKEMEKDSFIEKVYALVSNFAEENNVEVESDCWSTYIDDVEE